MKFIFKATGLITSKHKKQLVFAVLQMGWGGVAWSLGPCNLPQG